MARTARSWSSSSPAPCAVADFLALVAKDDDGKDYATISELIGMTLSEVEQRNEEGTFAADVVYSGLPLPANPSVVASLLQASMMQARWGWYDVGMRTAL